MARHTSDQFTNRRNTSDRGTSDTSDCKGHDLKKKKIQPYCPNGISPMWNSACIPRGKPAATESRYPTYGACWVFCCFFNPPNSEMDYGIFNVRTDGNACDCTRGCTNTSKRVCTESWLLEKNPGPHRGIEPASAACQSDALTNWATSPFSCLAIISAPSSEQHQLCGLSKSTHTPGLPTAGW